MYIYVMKDKEHEFIKFLKENEQSDDTILDRNNFNAHKIKLEVQPIIISTIANHFLSMPEGTTVTNCTESPGKAYILCIGEVDDADFFIFQKEISHLALATRLNHAVRVNFWVHYEHLNAFYDLGCVRKFTSINGKINSSIWVKLYGNFKDSQIQEKVFAYSDECIIGDEQLYVKCLIHDFSNLLRDTMDEIDIYEIIDEVEKFT